MKIIFQIAFVLTVTVVSTFGQIKGIPSNAEESKKSHNETKPEFENLKEIDLGFLKINIPDRLQSQEYKCIEGSCWKFRDNDTVFDIDKNVDAWRPTFERRYESYAEEAVVIDNVRAKIWSFQYNGRFVAGANYGIEKRSQIGLGIYLQSRSIDIRDVAKKIFLSAKFTLKPK